MTIEVRSSFSQPKANAVGLQVTKRGMRIVVEEGDFTIAKYGYKLSGKREHVVVLEDPNESLHIHGMLVLSRADAAATLIVDEHTSSELPYSFDADPDYDLLHVLFTCTVPAGATSLDDVELIVFHIAPPPPPKEPDVDEATMERIREEKRKKHESDQDAGPGSSPGASETSNPTG